MIRSYNVQFQLERFKYEERKRESDINLQSTFAVKVLILITQRWFQLFGILVPSILAELSTQKTHVNQLIDRTGWLTSLTGCQAILIGRGSVPVCSEPGWYDWLWPLLGLLGPLTGHPADSQASYLYTIPITIVRVHFVVEVTSMERYAHAKTSLSYKRPLSSNRDAQGRRKSAIVFSFRCLSRDWYT